MTHDEIIAVIQAHKDGKHIELREKHDFGEWKPVCRPEWDFRDYDYRVKPEPKIAPLDPEDVPPGTAVRWQCESWCMVVDRSKIGVRLCGRNKVLSWEEMVREWQFSTDNGKTWKPCFKETL
ncbi:MAG TPA: hypothetical protein VIV15_11125 [Anaerolineales bacterium]